MVPRSSSKHYLHTRARLRTIWDGETSRSWFFYLTAREQWDLHNYFQFTVDLADRDALCHRQAVTDDNPSLSHQAGKAVARLDRLIAHGPDDDPAYQREREQARKHAHTKAADTGKKPRVLTIRAEMRPDVDYKKIARALLMTARDLQEESDDSTARTPPAA